MSSRGAGYDGGVTSLDTVNFNETIAAYKTHVETFQEIVKGVNNTVNTLIGNWQGEGRNAFEKDSRQVQLNLNDISGIMYDIRDALASAHNEYIEFDSTVAKSYDS
jgi:WXG100 family type VII secretion target